MKRIFSVCLLVFLFLSFIDLSSTPVSSQAPTNTVIMIGGSGSVDPGTEGLEKFSLIDLGCVEGQDITPIIRDKFEERNKEPFTIVVNPGVDWLISTKLDVMAQADRDLYQQIHIEGTNPEHAWQLQEEFVDSAQCCRLVVSLPNDADSFIQLERGDPIENPPWGPLTVCNVCVKQTKGNFITIGDVTDTDAGALEARGLIIQNVYASYPSHFMNTWLVNGAQGWTLNRTATPHFIQAHCVYDIALQNVYGFGWWTFIELSQCDRPFGMNVRGGAVGRLLDIYSIPGEQQAAKGQFFGTFCESAFLSGYSLEGTSVHELQAECGYNIRVTPDIGAYTLPVGVVATMAVGSNAMTFTGFTGGKTPLDYFWPRTVVQLTPTADADEDSEIDEPPKSIFIESVDDTDITFRNSASVSYTPRAISDTGANLVRYFGTPAIVVGDRAEFHGESVHVNETLANFPRMFYVPGKLPLRTFGEATGVTNNTGDDSTTPRVVASSVGGAGYMQSGVEIHGGKAIMHPLAVIDETSPAYAINARDWYIDRVSVPISLGPDVYRTRIRHRAIPGRGSIVTGPGDTSSRELVFRTRLDDELGKLIAVLRLNDTVNGWCVGRVTKIGKGGDYTARVWCDDNDAVMGLYGGEGSVETEDLEAGWNDESGTLTDGQVLSDNITLGGSDGRVEVAEFIFLQ